MKSAANQAKTRWNANNYTQVKVHVNPEIASAFKETCQKDKISMASALSKFMSEYSKCTTKDDISTLKDSTNRRKRRRILEEVILIMESIRNGEQELLENMPENLRGSSNYEITEEITSKLDDIIDLLNDVY